MMRKLSLFLLLGCLWISSASLAAADKIDCGPGDYGGTVFASIHEAARASGNQLCQNLLVLKTFNQASEESTLALSLADFGNQTRDILIDEMKLGQIADISAQVEAMVRAFEEFADNPRFPRFRVKSGEGFFNSTDESTRFKIPENHPQCAALMPGKSCADLFRDLAEAFNSYRKPYDQHVAKSNDYLLDKLSQDWDRFLEVSKSQTALEVFLTSWFQDSHFEKNHLVGPPDYQIIALHPQVIYESLGEAPDGERLEAGIALEWFGINWWDTRVPFGISLTRVYVDRPSGKPYGTGMMLHFNNQYSIGFADHDGDNSVFVTIDLLKFLEDKKSNMEQHLETLK